MASGEVHIGIFLMVRFRSMADTGMQPSIDIFAFGRLSYFVFGGASLPAQHAFTWVSCLAVCVMALSDT